MLPKAPVQSVDRAIQLIEILATSRGAVTLSRLADVSQLPMPTIHRLIKTLMVRGYVRQLPTRSYTLGPRLIPIGERAGAQFGRSTRPHLEKLADELGESANLAIRDGDMSVYIAQALSPRSMRMFTEVGRRVFCHSTGVGKAILAQLDDQTISEIVQRVGMPPSTIHTITNLNELLTQVNTIREAGYAIDDGEQELGVRCISVPIPNATIPAALSISGPAGRVTDDFGVTAIPILIQCAHKISAQMSKSNV